MKGYSDYSMSNYTCHKNASLKKVSVIYGYFFTLIVFVNNCVSNSVLKLKSVLFVKVVVDADVNGKQNGYSRRNENLF